MQILLRFLVCLSFISSLGCPAIALARDDRPSASIPIAALPAEARHTLELIRRGGPFPYRRDGVVFQNRERRLPARQNGYYREYTVPTPGSSDRGARRIIAGARQEFYYSDDHYRSFKRIQERIENNKMINTTSGMTSEKKP